MPSEPRPTIEQIELNRGVTEKNIVDPSRSEARTARTLGAQDFCCADQEAFGLRTSDRADVSFTKRERSRASLAVPNGEAAPASSLNAPSKISTSRSSERASNPPEKFVEHSFNIFPEIYLERREHATDPIEACTVTLARPIMTSLQDGHFTCLNRRIHAAARHHRASVLHEALFSFR